MGDTLNLERILDGSQDPPNLPLALLKDITDDFSKERKIGSGGYAEVYKGVFNGYEIAVKRFFPVHGLEDMQFDNEFSSFKKVHHKNVLRMVGYCYETSHRRVEYQGRLVWSQAIFRALCFEYMKGGSLAKRISAESCIHDWPTTYKIISGTCEGLHHLHNQGENMVFHLDLTPDNILLDEELVPKIGGFSLSRQFCYSYTQQISTLKGTIGFMPQEYIHYYKVSPKNDVFSLGVIIFYMMAGQRGYGNYYDACHHTKFSLKIQQDFTEHVQEYWKTKMQASEGYRWDETDLQGVTKCIEIAMRCVEDDREKRPFIAEIIGELKELDSKMAEMLKEDPKPFICQQRLEHNEPTVPSESTTSTLLSALEMSSQAAELKTLEGVLIGTNVEPVRLSYPFIKSITRDFSQEIGRGGFGVVYLGQLRTEKVAVKKISIYRSYSETLFADEIRCLISLKHNNIVRFLGYCSETYGEFVTFNGGHVMADIPQRLLCFEYVPNGNLEKYLKEESHRDEWKIRYQMIKGICHGLKYLHDQRIIHLDLKPANIMLDARMNPKITDFGLSRCFDEGISRVHTTNIRGTPGTIAPEMIHKGEITFKSDIYSLGFIIIKLLTGRNKYEFENWPTSIDVDGPQVKSCIEIAQNCVTLDQQDRPTIGEILHKLNEMDSQ